MNAASTKASALELNAVREGVDSGRLSFVVRAGHLLGRRVLGLMVVCIVTGLLLGVIEILFGFALYRVLIHYDLLTGGLPEGFQNLPLPPPVPFVLGLAVVIFVVRGTMSALPNIATESLQYRIKRAITSASLSESNETHQLSVAETSHLLADLLPRSGGFISALTQMVTSAILALCMMTGVVQLSLRMTAITAGIAIIMFLPLVFAKRSEQRLAYAFFSASELFTKRMIRAIRNAVLLKISGTAEHERDNLVSISHTAERIFRKAILIQAVGVGLPLLGSVFIILALLEIQMQSKIFSVAELVPFVYLLSRLSGASSSLISSISTLRYNRASFNNFVSLRERIFLTAAPPHSGLPVTRLAQLEVENLFVGRDSVLVPNISFRLAPGEMLLISGPSGRGKTTLLMTLVGLVPGHGGKIRWNGTDIDDLDLWDLREQVGYAGADPYLLDASVEDNLLFGKARRALTETDYRKVLTCACAEFVYTLVDGLRHVLREGGDGVSAGQKQRIAIARALLRNPDVLILDEATGNVDMETEAAMIENIRREYPNAMIIAVSHRESLEVFATSTLRL